MKKERMEMHNSNLKMAFELKLIPHVGQ